MVSLALLWLALGLGVGALAIGARLGAQALGRRAWLLLPGIGALSAVLGGMLGSLMLSAFYGTATAVWVAVLSVSAGAWAFACQRKRTLT